VFLIGSKEIGLYMTVPKDSISYYRYNVLENDKEFLVTNGKLDASSAQNVFSRAQVNLGRFNIDNRKLTIEYYNLKSRDKVATTTIYNKVINPPELFLTTLEVINRKKVKGVGPLINISAIKAGFKTANSNQLQARYNYVCV
jgi:two-component system LytT family sensor kinase